jgi:hypothetical protein
MEDFDVVPFAALDGFQLNCWRYRHSTRTKGPVLLVHGAGVRANLFYPPNETNLVKMLAEAGYDVWLENWRASIEFPKNEWDLDLAGRYDHPAAVQKVCEVTGASQIKAIVHCQGSTSFMISAVLGLVPQVTTIITNAVSLHPKVPGFSRVKLRLFVPVVKHITSYMNPHWGKVAPHLTAKVFRAVVKLSHWEDDTTVGKFVSFTYGSGWPALWELANLSERTKYWIQDEFGNVPMHFFEHIRLGVGRGALAPFGSPAGTYADAPPQTGARLVFFAGKLNKCFSWESQQASFAYFDRLQPGKHSFYLLDKYSHLDVFLGQEAHRDVFPTMLRELEVE